MAGFSDITKLSKKSSPQSSNNKKNVKGTVWGSWGLDFQPAGDIERERTDGVTLLDLNPEARVFICGADVTKDVVSVTVSSHEDNSNTCQIVLANPKQKYNVSMQDLITDKGKSKWREDKDIEGTYEHSWLKKQGRPSFGTRLATLVKDSGAIAGELANQISSLVDSFKKYKNNIPVTKMLYEIKFYSKYDKKVGDVVFDFKDPVYVFFKGRFSTYWYFGFSGVVNSVSETYKYGGSQNITLKCIDPLLLLKRKRFTKQTPFLQAGMLEQSMREEGKSEVSLTAGNITNEPLNGVLKTVFFGHKKEFTDNILNSHFHGISEKTDPKADYLIPYYLPENSETATGGKPSPTAQERETAYLKKWYEYTTTPNGYPLFPQDDMDKGAYKGKKHFREFTLKTQGSKNSSEKVEETLQFFDIFFKFDSFVLNTSGDAMGLKTQKDLTAIVAAIKNYNVGSTITIIGHTDNNGDSKYNKTLSNNRARTIQNYLMSKLPADKNFTYKIEGRGMDDPYTGSYIPQLSEEEIQRAITGADVYSYKLNDTGEWEGYLTHKPLTLNGWSKDGSDIHDVYNRRVDIKVSGTVPVLETPQSSQEAYAKWLKEQRPYLADPNAFSFGPWSLLNLQYNEMFVSEYTESNLKMFYDTSLRFWAHYNPDSNGGMKELKGDEQESHTGWTATKAHGICGIHPALDEDFISKFHVIDEIYKAMMTKFNLLDQVNMTPLEKIQEQVLGIPTELPSINGPDKRGTQFNYFRPRLFFVYPSYIAGFNGIVQFQFRDLQIYKSDTVSTYDAIKEFINKTGEYSVYCSPMGDFFVEPLMYDFHPFKFYDKIEERDPVINKVVDDRGRVVSKTPIWFRSTIATTDGEEVMYRKDYAYLINPKANYPLFISNKDLVGFTNDENPEFYKTSITVIGAITKEATNAIVSPTVRSSKDAFAIGNTLSVTQPDTPNTPNIYKTGLYIADGFANVLRQKYPSLAASPAKREKYEKNKLIYISNLFEATLKSLDTSSLQTLVRDASRTLRNFALGHKNDSTLPIYVRGVIADCVNKLKADNITINTLTPDEANVFAAIKVVSLTEIDAIVINTLYRQLGDTLVFLNARSTAPDTKVIASAIDLNLLELLKSGMTVKDLLNLTISQISEGYFSGNGLPASIEASAAYSTAVQTAKSVSKARYDLLSNLTYFYEATFLNTVPDSFLSLNKDLYSFEAIILSSDIISSKSKTINYKKLKLLEKAHLYNPRLDIVSKYGIVEGPVVDCPFIQQGVHTVKFAKIIFNRYMAMATEYSLTIVGRPEIWRNRPYYIENKYSIGWLRNYTITYGINQPFTTTLQCSYIRKNAITYSYSMKELDTVVSVLPSGSTEMHDNKWFNDQANTYTKNFYKAEVAKQKAAIADTMFNNLSQQNSLLGTIMGAAGQELTNVASKLALGNIMSNGGIYVAHDYIGHLDYETKGIEEYISGTADANLKDDPRVNNNRLGPYYLMEKEIFGIFDMCSQLALAFKKIKYQENIYGTQHKLIKEITDQYEKVNKDLESRTEDEAKAWSNWSTAKEKGEDSKEFKQATLDKDYTLNRYNELYRTKIYYLEPKASVAMDAKDAASKQLTQLFKYVYGVDIPFSAKDDGTVERTVNSSQLGKQGGVLQLLYEAIPEKQNLIFGEADKKIRSECTIVDDKGYEQEVKNEQANMVDITTFGSTPLYIKVKQFVQKAT